MRESYFKTRFGLMYYKSYVNHESKDNIVLLHGWGMNSDTFNSIIERLKKDFNIYVVDFIGFGKSDEPLKSLTVENYSDMIHTFLNNYKIREPIIVGHSFGGRVAIKYGSKYNYRKIFLVNTPAFKNNCLKYYLKIIKYKILKYFIYIFKRNKYYSFIRSGGSNDYRLTKETMKGTFKKVVRYDLKNDLLKLEKDIIIISSINDQTVSYKDNQKMYKLVKNSKIYTFYNSTHFSYLEEEKKFVNIIIRECKVC